MSDQILEEIREQRREIRSDFNELRETTRELATSVSSLAQSIAKAEERHTAQQHINVRISGRIDDHEARLREIENDHILENRLFALENERAFLRGGWRAIVVVSTVVSGGIATAIAVANYWFK